MMKDGGEKTMDDDEQHTSWTPDLAFCLLQLLTAVIVITRYSTDER
jgi:hypothetical protein